MTLFKEIALISRAQTDHWNHEERFLQEDTESGCGTSARGSSTNPPDKM